MPSSVTKSIVARPEQSRLTHRDKPRSYTHLTDAERVAILYLIELQKSDAEIARVLNRAQSTITEFRHTLVDRTRIAKLRLRNVMPDLVDKFAAEAKPEDILEAFDREGVSEKRQTESQNTNFHIVVGMPGQPAGPDPFHPGNIISSYRTQTESAALIGQQVTDTDRKQIEAKATGETDAT